MPIRLTLRSPSALGAAWRPSTLARPAAVASALLALASAASAPLARAGAQPGAGATFGTRDPVTCARGGGPRGAPSAADVARLVRCDREGLGSSGSLTLVENLSVQVAAARAYVHVQDSYEDVDPRQPLYPVRGALTAYACDPVRTAREVASGFRDNRGRNCSYYPEPRASGVCYRDHFGDLHCRLYDVKADPVTTTVRDVPPPR